MYINRGSPSGSTRPDQIGQIGNGVLHPGSTIIVTGAIGPYNDSINGTFVATDRVLFGMTLFMKADSADIFLEWIPGRDAWCVRSSEQRLGGGLGDETRECFARVRAPNRCSPDLVTASTWEECGPVGGVLTFLRNPKIHAARVASASTSQYSSAAGGAAPLPQNFIWQIDPKTGRSFYVNTVTGKAQWERPTVATSHSPGAEKRIAIPSAVAAAATTARGTGVGTAAAVDPQTGLPPGYMSAVDPATGRTYFIDTVSKMSQWERPTVAAAAPANL